MSEEQLIQLGGAIGVIVAAAFTAFRVGVKRGANGSSGWSDGDRQLIEGLRDHISANTEELGELRSSIDKMSGFLQGRLGGAPGD